MSNKYECHNPRYHFHAETDNIDQIWVHSYRQNEDS